MSRSQVDNNMRNGRWQRIGPSVYRVCGAPASWLGSARALALSTGGLISHGGAARVHGLDGFERAGLEVTVGPTSSRSRQTQVRWHRSTQLELAGEQIVRGVPVTGVGRTVVDLAGVVAANRLDEIVDEVLRRRMQDWASLQMVLVGHARRGRTGCGPLRALLERRLGESAVPDSRWNRLVGALLTNAGLEAPRYEYVVVDECGHFVARADLAWPDRLLAVELDSVRFHHNLDSFVSDRRRLNRLTAAGWRMLTFTWKDFAEDPDGLVETVRRQLL